MEEKLLNRLQYNADCYYEAMIQGIPMDFWKKQIHQIIRRLLDMGVSMDRINSILSDAALRKCC